MKITWTIEKPRGNFRPVLEYKITLEDFEKALAMPPVSIASEIPQIPDPRRKFCLPGTNERESGWVPTRFHQLSSPSFRRAQGGKRIILPYTLCGSFVQVENSFRRLRQAFEREMQAARDSGPVLMRRELCLTDDTRKEMATNIAAHRMLQLVRE